MNLHLEAAAAACMMRKDDPEDANAADCAYFKTLWVNRRSGVSHKWSDGFHYLGRFLYYLSACECCEPVD